MFADPAPEWRAVADHMGADAWRGAWQAMRDARAMVEAELRELEAAG